LTVKFGLEYGLEWLWSLPRSAARAFDLKDTQAQIGYHRRRRRIYTQARHMRRVNLLPAILCALALTWSACAQGGKYWAVVVGVSKFQKLDAAQQLEFADKDAETFAKFIQSPRGRAFPKDNVKLLMNEAATTAQLRTALASWLKRNSKAEDMIYIFLATHGMVDKEEPRRAYLLTNEADPEDLYDTTLSMNDLGDIISTRLKSAGRIVLFADACRSGKLGAGIGADLQKGASGNQEIVGLLASRAKEFSEEGKQYCNGHGAFTCYLLKGLNGEADADKDGTVTVGELIRYLRDKVAQATKDKQTPQEFGEFENTLPMSFTDKPGIDLGFTELMFPTGFPNTWRKFPSLWAALEMGNAWRSNLSLDYLRFGFDQAIQDGRLLAPKLQNAWDQYRQLLQSNAPQSEKDDARDALAVSLEDAGQKILQTYLRGDASPLSAQDYRTGEAYFSRAAELNPDEKKLQAKARFCAGRALLSDRRLTDAEAALRDSVRIDPGGAYAYNALGKAYTDMGRADDAVKEFHTAFDNAPRWAYPHFNLAYMYVRTRRYREAEAEYKAAIDRGPNYAYLYRNLGSLYLEQLHRQDDAEKAFKKAAELGDTEAYDWLGILYQKRGDLRLAESNFRKVIELQPNTVAARINLAQLLYDANRKDDAEQMLRTAAQQDARDPNAHFRLGDLLMERGKLEDAELEFVVAAGLTPNDPLVFEHLGDLYVKQKRFNEAISQYNEALRLARDPADHARIDGKEKKAEKQK
jgi:tetratricopeptide (TPR) repeat protein